MENIVVSQVSNASQVSTQNGAALALGSVQQVLQSIQQISYWKLAFLYTCCSVACLGPGFIPVEKGVDRGAQMEDLACHRAIFGVFGSEVWRIYGQMEFRASIVCFDFPQICCYCVDQRLGQKDFPVASVCQALCCGCCYQNSKANELGVLGR